MAIQDKHIYTKKKQFTYRGKTLEELKEMDVREFAKFLPSRAGRAVLRQFSEIEKFVTRCKKRQEKGKPIRTHLRHLIIVPALVNITVNVYNGKEFISVKIQPEMLGHRLGEFSPTRTKVQHGTPGMGATRGSSALSVK